MHAYRKMSLDMQRLRLPDAENTRVKKLSVDLGRPYHPPPKVEVKNDNSTLLDKALAYRQQNSKSWEAREKDREITFMETFGDFQEDPFLADYYKKQDEKIKRKKEGLAKRKLEAPQMKVWLQYTLNDAEECLNENLDLMEDTFRRDSAGSDANETDIFKMSPSRRPNRTGRSVLTITIEKCKYLLNWLDTYQRKYDSCKIKCTMMPGSKKGSKKLKTREIYVNLKGTARCNHSFKIQGFSAEELQRHHIVLEVTGKNNQRKDVIGKAVLGGIKTTIFDGNSNHRGPTECEYEPWQQAIQNPGAPLQTKLVVRRLQDEFFSGETNTHLSRAQLLKSSPRPTRKWTARSPVKKNKLQTL